MKRSGSRVGKRWRVVVTVDCLMCPGMEAITGKASVVMLDTSLADACSSCDRLISSPGVSGTTGVAVFTVRCRLWHTW